MIYEMTNNNISDCDSIRWAIQPREVKFEPSNATQESKKSLPAAKLDTRHTNKSTPTRLQAVNSLNKNNKLIDKSTLYEKFVSSSIATARKPNVKCNVINSTLNLNDRATSARNRQREQRILEPVTLELKQKFKLKEKQMQGHERPQETRHFISPSSITVAQTHYRNVTRSRPVLPVTGSGTTIDLHVEGNSLRCNSETLLASHALEQLEHCVAMERSFREKWEAARIAKNNAFKQITKIVIEANNLCNTHKHTFKKIYNDHDCANIDNTNNNISNISNNVKNNNIHDDCGNGINYTQSELVNSNNTSIDIDDNVSNVHGQNKITETNYALSNIITNNHITADTLSLAKCNMITNTLIATIQSYIRYYQSKQMVHVLRHVLSEHLENRHVINSNLSFSDEKSNNNYNSNSNNTFEREITINESDNIKNCIAITRSTVTESVEDILDSEEVNRLKQLYFDYFDCEVISVDSPEWSSTSALHALESASDNLSALESTHHSLQQGVSLGQTQPSSPSPSESESEEQCYR